MQQKHRDPVSLWKQDCSAYLWRYIENTRNYPGWHLSLDRVGAESLLALFKDLQQSREPAYRTLEVSSPTPSVLRIPNNRGGAAQWRAPTKWRIAFAPDPADEQLWEFPVIDSTVSLRIGTRYLGEIIRGLNDIIARAGDYSIGGHRSETRERSTALWFWWQ